MGKRKRISREKTEFLVKTVINSAGRLNDLMTKSKQMMCNFVL